MSMCVGRTIRSCLKAIPLGARSKVTLAAYREWPGIGSGMSARLHRARRGC